VSLARAYLEAFELLDEDRIPPDDWRDARRISLRVSRDGRKRQVGDCIIRAICNRLNLDVLTADKRFPE
jgi:predicted nucleic acid-binding protein